MPRLDNTRDGFDRRQIAVREFEQLIMEAKERRSRSVASAMTVQALDDVWREYHRAVRRIDALSDAQLFDLAMKRKSAVGLAA